MKNSLKLIVLFLLLGTGVFAKTPKSRNIKSNEKVSIIPLHLKSGFAVMVNKLEPGKSMVILYDDNHNVVFKDMLTNETKAEKKYNLSYLNEGNYTLEVSSKNHDTKAPFTVRSNKSGQKVIRFI
jgi:hypothetical protein